MGPAELAGATLTANNQFSTSIAGTTVLFDGVPASLLYVRSDTIAAVVPYEVAGAVTQAEVNYQGAASVPLAVPVTTSTPAFFSADSSGNGQAAALNGDLSANSPSNPAAAGSTIVFYATGAGFTNPGSLDGSLAGMPLPKPLLPVTLKIGGVVADLQYEGAAPGLIAGLLQINATIPASLASGPQSAVLAIGSTSTQQHITISVR
jgi:uncharacterized protein (TIGR03437 family)